MVFLFNALGFYSCIVVGESYFGLDEIPFKVFQCYVLCGDNASCRRQLGSVQQGTYLLTSLLSISM
jgi:hypothetical protein